MYEPLVQLEETNTKCRVQLTKKLRLDHKVGLIAGRGEFTENGCRGAAFYFAFDPFQTCLRCPPASFRLFDAATKNGLLNPQEASSLSRTLINHGADLAKVYRGVFSSFYSDPHVKTLLNHLDDLEHLSASGLAIGDSWADRLFETCPFPLRPDRHLEVHSFRQITIEGEIEFYSQSPWLAWIEGLDLICFGPWIGLKPQKITTMVEALRQRTLGGPDTHIDFADDLLGQKVILPMFSRGLQGVVMGLFTDVPKAQREPILTTLLEFGETIADSYADLRRKHFTEAVEDDLTEKELAREVINITSPISRIIVMREGRRAGYKLGYESNYWSGYHALSNEELHAAPSPISFTVIGPNGSEIYIEPLRDVPALNTEFTRLRLENCLNQTVGAITTAQNGETLSLDEVQQLRSEFEAYTEEDNASLAKLRQYYVILKVEKNWEAGNVKVTNNELKRFLETELERELKNGYQVTSFVAEFEKIFEEKVLVTKATRNTLSLSWRRSG